MEKITNKEDALLEIRSWRDRFGNKKRLVYSNQELWAIGLNNFWMNEKFYRSSPYFQHLFKEEFN